MIYAANSTAAVYRAGSFRESGHDQFTASQSGREETPKCDAPREPDRDADPVGLRFRGRPNHVRVGVEAQ